MEQQLTEFAVIAVIMACVWLVMWCVSGEGCGPMLLYALALVGFFLFLWIMESERRSQRSFNESEVSQWVS